MATIKRYPAVRHFRGTPTGYVVHLQGGRVSHQGTGTSFWFRPLPAVISEIPVDDRELPILVHARTADFQDVTVQATVTYRFSDPAEVAQRVDFSIDTDRGAWTGNPLDQVARLLTELAQQQVVDVMARMTLAEALAAGVGPVRSALASALADDTRLEQTGLSVLDVRVVALRPEPDVEKALQTPTREQMQTEADRATYQRRALAVERERAISENELQSRIELATREEQLVAQEGVNQRRRAEETAVADRISAQSDAEQVVLRGQANASATQTLGEAEAAVEAAKMMAVHGVDPAVLLALALRPLAENLPNIGSLTVTPDLLSGVLAQLVHRQEN
jgi:regulator of protease activity HflC (stomatin/prohibitin superfamily)